MDAIEILGKIILIPYVFIYILLLAEHRYNMRKTIFLSVLLITVFTFATYMIIFKLNYLIYVYPILDVLYRYGNAIVLTLFMILLTKERLAQGVFIIASVLVVVAVIGVLAMAILQVGGVPELCARVLLHTLFAMLLILARKHFLVALKHIKKGWWLLSTVPIFLIVNFLFITSIPVSLERNPVNMPTALFLCATTFIIYIAFYFVFHLSYRDSEHEQNILSLRHFVNSLERQNELICQNAQTMLMFKHDMRHITHLLISCLDRNDLEGAKELLHKMENNVSVTANAVPIPVTGHKLLDTTITNYIHIAKELGIDISVSITGIDRLNRDIDMTEFAVVISNALENAIHACRNLNDNINPVIRVDGKSTGKQFYFEIANTNTNEVQFNTATGLPLSHMDGHGLGVQSIAYFARKNGGKLEFSYNNNWFKMQLLL